MTGTVQILPRCGLSVYDLDNSFSNHQTEIIFSTDQHCVSYVQVRGTVPRVYLVLVECCDTYILETYKYSGNSKVFKHSASVFKSRVPKHLNQLSSATSLN
jgi:hypothetical protein